MLAFDLLLISKINMQKEMNIIQKKIYLSHKNVKFSALLGIEHIAY